MFVGPDNKTQDRALHEPATSSPALEQARSTLPRVRKEDENENIDFGLRQKLYDSDLQPFDDNTTDKVPIITPRMLTNSITQAEEERKQREQQKLEFEKFLQEEELSPSFDDSQDSFQSDDEDIILPDRITKRKPKRISKFRKSRKAIALQKRPITKMEDAPSVFKGRMSLPKGPDGLRPDFENEKLYTDEARRYLKHSVVAYTSTKPPA